MSLEDDEKMFLLPLLFLRGRVDACDTATDPVAAVALGDGAPVSRRNILVGIATQINFKCKQGY